MADIAFLGATPLERVKKLMEILRSPEGCPWDREQSFETIAPYTIEEAYEVREAITQNDMESLKEELGDLMFQVIFHSRMAEEIDAFTVEEVIDNLTEKMVRRHPHVFAGGDDRSVDEQTIAWEEMKAMERANKPKNQSLLDDVPIALPALMRAEKLQKRAARVGFDWPDLDGVFAKINEEQSELIEAIDQKDAESIEDEMGDFLFAVTNLSRKLGIDPEKALRGTNDKFSKRFKFIEEKARTRNEQLEELSLEVLEKDWQEAKKL